MKKLIFLKSFLILGIFFFSFSITNAQLSSSDILFNVFPEYPGPNQEVKAEIKSYATNLSRSNIVWSVNKQPKLIGIGKTTFTFNTGELGETINLSVNIETLDGQTIEKEFNINPTSVDLLWEAVDSYAPPFYKGKTLVSKEGQFKVVAIPNIKNSSVGSQSNMLYTWSKDGKKQQDSSGWGKNYFIFKNGFIDQNNTINVQISNINGTLNASNNILLSGFSPKIVFYKKDEAGNVLYNQSVKDGFLISENGESIVVAPYFFSPNNLASKDLTFKWFLNDLALANKNLRNDVSLIPSQGKGKSTLKVLITNKKTLFQEATKSLSVDF